MRTLIKIAHNELYPLSARSTPKPIPRTIYPAMTGSDEIKLYFTVSRFKVCFLQFPAITQIPAPALAACKARVNAPESFLHFITFFDFCIAGRRNCQVDKVSQANAMHGSLKHKRKTAVPKRNIFLLCRFFQYIL